MSASKGLTRYERRGYVLSEGLSAHLQRHGNKAFGAVHESEDGTILPMFPWVLLQVSSRSRFGAFLTLSGPHSIQP